jgi:hypothetical protein
VTRAGAACALLALSTSGPHAPAAAAGLCAATETTFFACNTSQAKSISLCGAPPRTLQYRFGSAQRPALAFPRDPSAGAASFLYAHYFRYRTDRSEVTFNNQSVDYAIFDYTEDGKRRAGVRVTTSGGKETELVCSGPIISRLGDLKGVLQCDPDNALNSGGCP